MKARQWDHVRLLEDVEGYRLPHVPAGTYGVVTDAYELLVKGYFVDVAIRHPGTGERLYDNVVLRPEQLHVLRYGCGLDIDAASLSPGGVIGLIERALGGSVHGRIVTKRP